MNYIYILKSLKDNKKYIVSWTDIQRRVAEHLSGLVESTACRFPLKLYGFRAFQTIDEAALFAKKYKRSHGQLERDIKNGKITLIS